MENEAIKELKQNIEMPFGSDISNEASKTAIKALEEIQQYRAIGTVEECQEARKRRNGKKVTLSHNGCVKDKRKAFCPNCGLVIHGKRMIGYCSCCGQKLYWSE